MQWWIRASKAVILASKRPDINLIAERSEYKGMETAKMCASTPRNRRRKKSGAVQVLERLARNKSAMGAMIVLGIIVLLAIFAPLIMPYDPLAIDMAHAFEGPSLAHWCGCDSLGRDILSRLIYGARWSLSLGLCASLGATVIGIILGCIAGFFGGAVENIIMRFCDIIQAIPGMLLSIVISTVLGAGFLNTIIALAIGPISGTCRMIRAQILSERDKEYLEAAASIGGSVSRIMFKHMLPNVVSPVIVTCTMGIGVTIMGAAGLSFIGLGVLPPSPEWGAMLSAGRNYVLTTPHIVLFPGLCIALTVLLINIFGDGLRDAMDPRLKR